MGEKGREPFGFSFTRFLQIEQVSKRPRSVLPKAPGRKDLRASRHPPPKA